MSLLIVYRVHALKIAVVYSSPVRTAANGAHTMHNAPSAIAREQFAIWWIVSNCVLISYWSFVGC